MLREEIIWELQDPDDMKRAGEIYDFVGRVRFASGIIQLLGLVVGASFFLFLPKAGWKWELLKVVISLIAGLMAAACARAAFLGDIRQKLVRELETLLESGAGYCTVLSLLVPGDYTLNRFLRKYLPRYADNTD